MYVSLCCFGGRMCFGYSGLLLFLGMFYCSGFGRYFFCSCFFILDVVVGLVGF